MGQDEPKDKKPIKERRRGVHGGRRFHHGATTPLTTKYKGPTAGHEDYK